MPLDRPRIMGQETEYSVIPDMTAAALLQEHLMKSLPDSVVDENQFLSNGARFYLDIGNHPEYATPECTTGLTVATAAAAGTLIVRKTIQNVVENVFEHQREATLYKRTSFSGNTVASGDHENYFMRNGLPLEHVASMVTPHLVSRIIFSGVGQMNRSGTYSLDQRTFHMGNEVIGGRSTTNYRPFVLKREEPHSKVGTRLQVISGSANMMTAPIRFRFDSTSLALRLIEHGLLPDWLELDQPANAMRAVASEDTSSDYDFRTLVTLKNGARLTAPQLQYEYVSRLKQLADAGDLNNYDAEFTDQWMEMTNDALDGKIEKWKTSIEWLAKLALIDRYSAERPAVTIAKKQLLDLQFHEVGTKTITSILAKKGHITEVIDQTAIAAAEITAPDNCRGRVRGIRVKQVASGQATTDITKFNWASWPLKSGTDNPSCYALRELQGDPYCTVKDFADDYSSRTRPTELP